MNSISIASAGDSRRSPLKLVIAVPARLGSTRLPRKPLALLSGKPLVTRVAERVTECSLELGRQLSMQTDEILTLVATDSKEVASAVEGTGVRTVMTAAELPSGTDRIRAALANLPADDQKRLQPSTLVINLQGDEPFFHDQDILTLASAMFADANLPMGTLAFPQSDPFLFMRTSVVKVVCNQFGNAIYFSRSPLPWPRELLGAAEQITELQKKVQTINSIPFLQHVGVYAFRFAALEQFTSMAPSKLELTEGLEQLRAIENGWSIRVVQAHEAPFGIDTPDDLLRAEKRFNLQGQQR
ncbi:MAG: hypothetical protein RLZZ488_2545 [Pseudomonadota bacterium]|jgi:3-deoxy-manno-octulosonate cytidylyltransferase (CMP-KDO synthetase)